MMSKASIEGLRRFLKHAEALKPQNNALRENGFAKEFQEIKDLSSRLKKDPSFSTRHGEKDVNRPKNRYRDILPYDYSRIFLTATEGVDGSDYINGNYIKGPTEEVLYLAAQGPLPVTVNDFWKMIISHQTQVIVMACREYELGKLKCKRYWPEKLDEKLKFEACEVSLISQEELGEGFIIRTLSAKHPNGEHKVTQFHYTAWPDHDVPRSATPLIELTMSFRAFAGNENNVPVLIHCSAGCGRTGTICALDYALNLIKIGRAENFSVFDIVTALRRQRIAMVQTKEQYELVYKAVKEIVGNELLKQRASMHTYVNVAVGEEMPEPENTYENVEFIRSIQRLHEEEKNASRLPKELPSKAIVVSSKKDIVLAPQKKKSVPTRSQPDAPTNHVQGKITNQKTKASPNVSKESVQQATTKPPLKKKPQSGYENILPLSVANSAPKPPLVPKPKSYVNVVIGTATNNSADHDSDYVNVPKSLPKSVPVPEKKNEPKPVPLPPTAKPTVQTNPVPPHPYLQRMASSDGKNNGDYVIPPLPKKEERDSGYVIAQNFVPNVNNKPVAEGNLVDLFDSGPTSLPILGRSSSEHDGLSGKKMKSLEPVLKSDLSRSTPSLEPKDTDKSNQHTNKKQTKTTQRLSLPGQYSLVGGIEIPGSPNISDDRDPFENAPKIKENVTEAKGRSSFGMVESVVADSAPVKPVIAPRRSSENLLPKGFVNQANLQGKPNVTQTTPQGSDSASRTLSQGKPIIGSYSMVNIPNEKDKTPAQDECLVDLSETSNEPSTTGRNSPHRRVQKSYSTENIISDKKDLYSSVNKSKGASTEAISSVDSSSANYSSVLRPFTRRSSEDVLSPSLYSSVGMEVPSKPVAYQGGLSSEEKGESSDVLGNGYSRKKPLAVRRSNSGVTPYSVNSSNKGDVQGLYATVGAKTKDKRRTPLPTDMWSNGSSPASSLERCFKRSNNSSSSLRSVDSASSNDSFEDAPPVPLKTSDAFCYPDDDDAYEAVQKSSSPRSTLGRFKNKAKNMMTSGPQLSKLSLGKKSPPFAASSDSLSFGEGQDLYVAAKGYGSHVGKPVGARSCPSNWPKFSK